MRIHRTSRPRVCRCGRTAPWKYRNGDHRPAYLCEDHARVVAARPGVRWVRQDPPRTVPAPGIDPYASSGSFAVALKVTADPTRGQWRTRA